MSAIHYGGQTVGLPEPICSRSPRWASMTNCWESVTCKWCLRLKPDAAPAQSVHDSPAEPTK